MTLIRTACSTYWAGRLGTPTGCVMTCATTSPRVSATATRYWWSTYADTATMPRRGPSGLRPLAPMSSSGGPCDGCGWFGVGDEGVEDDVGQSALEDSDRFGLGVSVGSTSLEERPGFGVVVRLSDGDAVERGVDLPIAATAEPVAFSVARPDRQRGGAVVAGVGVPGPEPSNVRGLPEDLGGAQGGAATDLQQCRREPRTSLSSSLSSSRISTESSRHRSTRPRASRATVPSTVCEAVQDHAQVLGPPQASRPAAPRTGPARAGASEAG